MTVWFCVFRVEGVHAIIVTDREGVPLLQGALLQISFYIFCLFYMLQEMHSLQILA